MVRFDDTFRATGQRALRFAVSNHFSLFLSSRSSTGVVLLGRGRSFGSVRFIYTNQKCIGRRGDMAMFYGLWPSNNTLERGGQKKYQMMAELKS